jgi:FkbM family methyltransferase
MYSFSQNFEDVYIYRAFRDVAEGFYIDVGAFDPVVDSVTKLFYDLGWSGINIEPGPLFPNFESRTRDINLPYAISSKEGEILFHYNAADPGTSTTVPSRQSVETTSIQSYKVTSMTLEAVVRAHAPDRHIHFIKLDIEGAEWEVLRSTDWNSVRPELLIAESSLPYTNTRRDDGWADHMKSFGYDEIFFDGINTYYLREESRHRGAAFEFPVNVLDGIRKFDPQQNHVLRDSENTLLINNFSKELARVLKEEGSTVRGILERELGPNLRAQSDLVAKLTSEQSENFSRLQVIAKDLSEISCNPAPVQTAGGRSNSIEGMVQEIADGISNLVQQSKQYAADLILAQKEAEQARDALREQKDLANVATQQVQLLTRRLGVARASRMTMLSMTEHVVSALNERPGAAKAEPTVRYSPTPPLPAPVPDDVSALANRIARARAIPAWRKLMRIGIRAFVRRADSFRDTGHFQAAALAYAQAYGLRPDRADLCLQMANMLTNLGEFALAESAYHEALDKAPGDPLVLLHLGHMLEQSNRPAEAWRAYTASAKLLPDHPHLIGGLRRTRSAADSGTHRSHAEA